MGSGEARATGCARSSDGAGDGAGTDGAGTDPVTSQTRGRPFASVDDYGRRLRITIVREIVRGQTSGIVDYD
jgi:hypothetical protein